jgi:hypothetical protein
MAQSSQGYANCGRGEVLPHSLAISPLSQFFRFSPFSGTKAYQQVCQEILTKQFFHLVKKP